MKKLLLLAVIAISNTVNAQNPGFSWIKTANGTGNEQANDIVASKDNFIYTCGSFSSGTLQLGATNLSNGGGDDIFLTKYDTAGNLIWAKRYGSTGTDNAIALATDSLSNIYLTGSCAGPALFGSLPFPGGNFILKIGSSGTESWVINPASNVTVKDIAADPQGNTVICGYFTGSATIGSLPVTATASNDGFIARFNTSGVFNWMKQLYSTSLAFNYIYSSRSDKCKTLCVAPNGNIGISGSYEGTDKLYITDGTVTDSLVSSEVWDPQRTYGSLGFIVALNQNGGFLFAKDDMNSTNSGRYWTTGISIACNSNADFFIGAETSLTGSGTSTNYMKLIKYNNTGLQQWIVNYTAGIINNGLSEVSNARVACYNDTVYAGEKIIKTGIPEYQKSRIHCINTYGTEIWSSLYTNTNSDINGLAIKDKPYAAGILSNAGFGNLTATYLGGTDGFISKLEGITPPVSPLSFSPAIADKIICPGGSVNLAPGVVVSGGVQPYTFSWSPAAGLNDPALLNPLASPSLTTNYILTIRDARDSVLRDTVTVTIRTQLVKPVISLQLSGNGSGVDTLICNSPDTGLSYEWFSSGVLVGTNSSLPVQTNTWGIYTVNVKALTGYSSGCFAASDIFYHNVIKANAGRDTVICPGQSVTLGGTPAYYGMANGSVTYSWSPVTGLNNPLTAHPVATPLVTTDYILYANDQPGFPKIPDTVRVTVLSGVTPVITPSGSTTFCDGDSVVLTASLAATYLWNTGATTQSITVYNSGSFHVTTTQTTGCGGVSSDITVTVNPAATAPAILPLGPTTFCDGNSILLNASPAFSYLWSTGETTQQISVTTSGTYTVQVTNSYGCLSPPAVPVTITVNPLPATPTISASGPTTFCQGSSVILTSSPGLSYLWSNAATSASVTAGFSDTYTVQVGDANGCISLPSAPVITTANPLPATPAITASGPTTFCQGTSILLSSSPGLSYLWSNGATSASVTCTGSNTYSVIVGDANGCMSFSSPTVATIMIPVPATPQILPNGPVSFCQGGSVTLTSSVAGNSYIWNNIASSQSSVQVSSSSINTVKVVVNGCTSAASAPVTVTVNPLPARPAISAGGPTTFCEGGNVVLTSGTGVGYLWSNGQTFPAITVNSTGNYSVRITDSNNCVSPASDIVAVVVNLLPSLPVITQIGNLLLSSAATGNQWYFNGQLIPGATQQEYIFSNGGNYSVEETNASGCKVVSAPVSAIRAQEATLRNGEPVCFQVNANPLTAGSVVKITLKSVAVCSICLVDISGRPAFTIIREKTLLPGTSGYPIGRYLPYMHKGLYYIVYVVNGERFTQKIEVL